MAKVVLHDYWRSSSSYRVRIALALAGIAYDRVAVDLVKGDQRGAHLAVNPQGLVPVLEIDGLVLTQSLSIIEYLDETRGLGLLPADPLGRARVRALSHAVAMEIQPVCNLRVAAQSGQKTEDWMRAFITPGLADLEAMLGTDDFCHGASPTLADLCLVPQVYNARRWGAEVPPKIAAIVARAEALPAFAAAHPDRFKP